MFKNEYNEIQEILKKTGTTEWSPEQLVDMSEPVYEDLFGYYMNSGDMPYGIQKARTGMPDVWICDRLTELFDNNVDTAIKALVESVKKDGI